MKSNPCPLLLIALAVALFPQQIHAAPVTLWQIGEDDDPFSQGYSPTDEFSQEDGQTNAAPGRVTRLPGDPAYQEASNPSRDDHFYQSGQYPAGFNGLTAPLQVPNAEPASAFGRALVNTDPTNFVHFRLTPSQSNPLARLRLTFELVDGGSWSPITGNGENFGQHHITVRLINSLANTLILQRDGVDRNTRFSIEIPAAAVQAMAGPNTLQFTRSGPSVPAGDYTWIHFDFVKLEVDEDALADGDSDLLPRWWERDHRLDDANSADATLDVDGDGLTALQEYNGGILPSDPRRADTDGDGAGDAQERTASSDPNRTDTDDDGLSDAQELIVAPTSSPLLIDTDGDGHPDAWEKRVGTNPRSNTDFPSPFSGAIGLNFVSMQDPRGSISSYTPAGLIPQLNWNNTLPLRTYARTSGNTQDIQTPTPDIVTKANGQAEPGISVSWASDQTSATYNDGTADQRLMNGFIRAYDSTPATITLSGIPFATYHIIAYVGGDYDGQQANIRLNNDSSTLRSFTTQTAPPQNEWIEIPANPAAPFPIGNFVYYKNRTGSSFNLTLDAVQGYSMGLHAIQIIDATLDADLSGIPDWYEMQYALQPTGPATASADSDGDGLTHLQEYQRGTHPRRADSDGDGLPDGQETAANALNPDSDGDGLSDYDEVTAPLPSDPSLADTDGDGHSDKAERERGTDPTVDPAALPGGLGLVPVYSAQPATWEWKIEPVQLVWDHGAGATGGRDGYQDTLFALYVGNSQSDSRRSLDLRLRTQGTRLTYLFESFQGQAFSAANNPNANIYLEDTNNPPPDLKAALGFSGYGPADISDRLRFRLLATRGTTNAWSVRFEIFNLTKNTTAISRLVSQSTAAPSIDAGTALWQDSAGIPNLPSFYTHEGLRCFVTPTPLESLPAFASHADTDNDGMPNTWETTYQFNLNSPSDANQDADFDGLKNREEYLAGIHPRLRDTDGDGIDDRVERTEGSNPLLPQIKPLFAAAAPTHGADLNQNNLPDAWETRFHATGISPLTDSDGDGATNLKEAAWGTDPFDSKSFIALTLARDGNDALLSWTRNPWKRQRVHRSPGLDSWQPLSLLPEPDGANDNARIPGQYTSSPAAFFALETLDKDSDGDGLADWDELFLGSSPYQSDSARAPSLSLDHEGNVTGSVSGDYTAFITRFKDALPGPTPGQITREQAARFLQQASFGPTLQEIERVQSLGLPAWIDQQILQTPATYHRPIIESMVRDLRGPRLDLRYDHDGQNIGGNNTPTPFARAAIAGQDQLRQRIAFALSQILVTSRRDPNLSGRPLGMTDYYDIFVRHAFGNYRQILQEVSLHPVMGRYLSHIGNQKARPEINQFPDENYARECMQLFTIGLWELNPDGTRKRDANGNFIPTYDNGDVTELARVFTGLWFGGQRWNNGGYSDASHAVPMSMWAEKHDFAAKTLLGGLHIPARPANPENGLRDISDALDFLFEHPNTPPFISRQLIQFLVTSNPTPAYVARVSAVFANNGNGTRGDLAAVTRAILLDQEARDVRWSHGSPTFGRLKEPVQRAMALARAGRLARFPSVHWWDYGDFYEDSLQSPGNSPSVFNFYRPDYRAPGLLTSNQLAAPAFQITNSYTSISFTNRLWQHTLDGIRLYELYQFHPDYQELLALASQPPLLADRANLLFCGGMMSAATRAEILDTLGQVPATDPLQRVQLTVFLACASPDGAVQR